MLEEAAIDGIPSIVIDPKGDLGNLLLTFPDLKPADFTQWVDPAEAQRKGITPDQLAEQTARLDTLKAADRPSQAMTAKAQEGDTAVQGAKAKADTKDFVGGLEEMKAVE